MIVVVGPAFSQTWDTTKRSILPILHTRFYNPYIIDFKKSAITNKTYRPFLPADFYSTQLGFFCRQEIKMDKVPIIPIRFRLGSIEQCNWLEGKKRQ